MCRYGLQKRLSLPTGLAAAAHSRRAGPRLLPFDSCLHYFGDALDFEER
jgi:hypothetical protein